MARNKWIIEYFIGYKEEEAFEYHFSFHQLENSQQTLILVIYPKEGVREREKEADFNGLWGELFQLAANIFILVNSFDFLFRSRNQNAKPKIRDKYTHTHTWMRRRKEEKKKHHNIILSHASAKKIHNSIFYRQTHE